MRRILAAFEGIVVTIQPQRSQRPQRMSLEPLFQYMELFFLQNGIVFLVSVFSVASVAKYLNSYKVSV